jgi:hypothetical protein
LLRALRENSKLVHFCSARLKAGICLIPAKILLALAALREMNPEIARAQLSEFVAEFPENLLFANELAKVKVTPAATISPR